MQPTRAPEPTSEIVAEAEAPATLEPTATLPSPTPTPIPLGEPPDAIFRGSLSRTGFYDAGGPAPGNRLK